VSRRHELLLLDLWLVIYIGTFIALVAFGLSETYIPLAEGTL